MALIQAKNCCGGDTPTTNALAWQRDRVEQTDPFSSGYTIALTETPIDEDSIVVISAGQPLDQEDYTYDSGANTIEILFSADPATDAPDGVWIFTVTYPYETSSPSVALAWQRDRVEETDPFSSGYTIALTETPIDEDSIFIVSAGQPLDQEDYTYDSGANTIEILFSADPATDAPDGVWIFTIQYPYEV